MQVLVQHDALALQLENTLTERDMHMRETHMKDHVLEDLVKQKLALEMRLEDSQGEGERHKGGALALGERLAVLEREQEREREKAEKNDREREEDEKERETLKARLDVVEKERSLAVRREEEVLGKMLLLNREILDSAAHRERERVEEIATRTKKQEEYERLSQLR